LLLSERERERERIMRSRNIVRLVKQEGRSRGKLEHACVFCAVEIFDLCAAKVYDASNIKEEISSTSDRAKKVLPLRHDGVLFERASLLDVFDERERERSEIRDCEIEMQRIVDIIKRCSKRCKNERCEQQQQHIIIDDDDANEYHLRHDERV